MKYSVEKLVKSEELERIKTLCSFNGVKYNIKQGKIINFDGTNISYIVPIKLY